MTPSPELRSRVARLMGADPVAWTPVQGGYTPAGRWVVQFATGASAFVKVGTTPDTSAWLRAEHGVYSRIRADFLPALLGWEDGEAPVLVLEDLSRAAWPPPWSPGRVDQVLAALAAIAATPPPPGTPPIAARHSELRSWRVVAADPAPFLSLGLCSAAWLDAALPALLAADAAAVLDGEHLLHLDVRSDNLCFVGERAVLVDWNLACRGNPAGRCGGVAAEPRRRGRPRPADHPAGCTGVGGADGGLLRGACRIAAPARRAARAGRAGGATACCLALGRRVARIAAARVDW